MSNDLLPITLAYAVAIACAVLTLTLVEGAPLYTAFMANLVATVVIFLFSRAYRNSSFYDAYWSVIPPLLVVYWALFDADPGVLPARQALVLILIWLWGIRLTVNWGSHWPGLNHEDWRYAPIKEKAGRWGWLADFGAIHLFPTLIVYLACLPVYAAVHVGQAPLNLLDLIAFIVTAGAITIETVADVQLHRFLANKKPGDIIDVGLWRYSRHPNYFGEMSFWIGLMLFGLAAYPAGWWWILPGAMAMTGMFFFASIPLMDKRNVERRPGYKEHMQKVSAIIPWFRG